MSTKPNAPSYPWRGFERPPEGCLFEQLVDLRGEMGVAYERSLRFQKTEHVHDRVLFVLPRSGTAMRLRFAGAARGMLVTSGDGAVVPAGLPHGDTWETDVYDTLALLPSHALVARATSKCEAPDVARAAGFDGPAVFRRSGWLDALIDEYFTERVLGGRAEGPRHAALEELLLFELLRLSGEARSERVPDRPTRPGPSSAIARALRYVEAHLFRDIDLDELSSAAAVSRSSLTRHFHRELATTPKAYVLGRRLDEAKRLLATGRYNVREVARLVGYSNAGAFTEAFQRRFGAAPSALGR